MAILYSYAQTETERLKFLAALDDLLSFLSITGETTWFPQLKKLTLTDLNTGKETENLEKTGKLLKEFCQMDFSDFELTKLTPQTTHWYGYAFEPLRSTLITRFIEYCELKGMSRSGNHFLTDLENVHLSQAERL